MPVPLPRKGEEEDKFIPRCMRFMAEEGGRPHDQQQAICYSAWRKKHPEASKSALKDGVLCEKKYDGVRVLVMKSANRIRIVTEDGRECSSRLPFFVASAKEMSPGSFTLDGELEQWCNGERRPREEVAAYLLRRSPPEDSELTLNIFGLLLLNGKDYARKTELERRSVLSGLGWEQSTFDAPEPGWNLVPSVFVREEDGFRKTIEILMGSPGSEGVVVKKPDALYGLKGAGDGWVSLHKSAGFNAMILQTTETSRRGVYNCRYGLDPGDRDMGDLTRIGDKTFAEVGRTFSTAHKAAKGEVVAVEVEGLSVCRQGGKEYISARTPRFIGVVKGGQATSVSQAVQAAQREGILAESAPSPSKSEFPLPPEDGTYRYVIQSHYRGKDAHLDFRTEIDGYLTGWTLMHSKPGAITEPVETAEKAALLDADPSRFKVDLQTGKFRERLGKKGQKRPANIMSASKAKGPVSDLSLEGVDGSSVFRVVDKGTVEFGAAKPFFVEYFLSGGNWNGRLLFRMLSSKRAYKGETDKESDFYWVCIQPADQTPYVLSVEAVRKKWLPPLGRSCLSKAMKEMVPEELQFWKETDREKRLGMREELVSLELAEKAMQQPFGSSGGKYFLAATIVPLFPEHRVYVEAFAGGASVFWKKDPSEKEVLNDADPRIMNAFIALKSLAPGDIKTLEAMDWSYNRSNYDRARLLLRSGTLLQKFWALIMVKHMTYGADIGSATTKGYFRIRGERWGGVGQLAKLHERVQAVEMRTADYKDVLTEFDGPDTFFYLDPPYTGKAHADIGTVPHIELARALRGLKGKFLLSLADSKENEALFGAWKIQKIKRYTNLDHRKTEQEKTKISEILVSNYDAPAGRPAQKSTTQPVKEATSSIFFEFTMKNAAQQIVGGVVYPAKKIDTDGEWAGFDAIQEAMYLFMESDRQFSATHKGADFNCTVLECFQAEAETEKGGGRLDKGDWWVTLKIHDETVWDDVEKGELRGFSWEGLKLMGFGEHPLDGD